MSVHLGALQILSFRWQTATAIAVEFESGHTDSHYQLYAGRRLLAETVHPEQRELIAQYPFERWQEYWRVVAVDGLDVGVDHGSKFPPRPESVARIQFSTVGWAADADLIDIHASTAPGGAVDPNNRIGRILYEGEKSYVFDAPPRGPSGVWSFDVQGRDDKPKGGNAGTADSGSVTLLSIPPDFDDGFGVSFTGGIATITATVPVD